MGLSRRVRRQARREAMEQMDERQMLVLRLGQKDAQLFQAELNLHAAMQEINRLTEANNQMMAELNKSRPVEEIKDGVEVVEAEELPEGQEDQTSEG